MFIKQDCAEHAAALFGVNLSGYIFPTLFAYIKECDYICTDSQSQRLGKGITEASVFAQSVRVRGLLTPCCDKG